MPATSVQYVMAEQYPNGTSGIGVLKARVSDSYYDCQDR